MIGLSCSSARIVRNVPSRCFYPAPKVDSAIFAFVPMSAEERLAKWGIDPEEVMKVAKAGFAHPRKLLASNLGRGASPFVKSTSGDRQGVGRSFDKDAIEHLLVSLGLSPKARAEELSIDQWAALAKGVNNPPTPLSAI
jgi:16S rRNA (adenine1518-N6/adenine1519-N6)-dimethyltransferase